MEMSEAWLDTFDEGYVHQFQREPTHKIHWHQQKHEFRVILPWKISKMITKTVPITTRIAISYTMKQGILLWIWQKVNGNWDNNMVRISQWRQSLCRTNTHIRRKKEIQISRTVRITVWDLSTKVNHSSKVIWDDHAQRQRRWLIKKKQVRHWAK